MASSAASTGSVSPAGDARAEVAADGGGVADLRRADGAGRLGQRRQPAGQRVLAELAVGDPGADPHRAGRWVVRHERSSLTRPIDTTLWACRCPLFISTIRSVPPASTSASGDSARARARPRGRSRPLSRPEVQLARTSTRTVHFVNGRSDGPGGSSHDRDRVEPGLGGRQLGVDLLERLQQQLRDGSGCASSCGRRAPRARARGRWRSGPRPPRTRAGSRPTARGRRGRRGGTSTASPDRRGARCNRSACSSFDTWRNTFTTDVPSSTSIRSNSRMCR